MGLTILDSDYMNMAYKFEYRFLNEKTTLTKEHNHNFYEYFIITNGELNHHIGKYAFQLKKGDMALIRPKECHRLEIDTQKSFNMINISMCKDVFNQVYDYFGQTAIEDLINCEFPLTISLSEKQLLSLIKKHELFYVVSGVRDSTILLKTLLSDVLYYFLTRHPNMSPKYETPLKSFISEMNTPENISRGLPALLSISGYSHGHLCRIMKDEMGLTPIQYINNLRLNYASKLLVSTDLDILNISLQVGYSSLSHFIKLFKSFYGVTPLKYRKSNSKIFSENNRIL